MIIRNAKNCQVAETVYGDAIFGGKPSERKHQVRATDFEKPESQLEVDGGEHNQIAQTVMGDLVFKKDMLDAPLELSDGEALTALTKSIIMMVKHGKEPRNSTNWEAVRCVFCQTTGKEITRKVFAAIVAQTGVAEKTEEQIYKGIANLGDELLSTPFQEWPTAPKLQTNALKKQLEVGTNYRECLQKTLRDSES